jgi:hypothetical protein
VSVGIGALVVSIGIVLDDVSIVDGAGVVVLESEDIDGDVSEPVEWSGVSQPIVAIAKKAMKRMLFMRNYFSVKNIFPVTV